MEFHRVNCNAYGHPRVVIHYSNLLTQVEVESKAPYQTRVSLVDALTRLRGIPELSSATAYRGRDFGGGLVITSFLDNRQIERLITQKLSELEAEQRQRIEDLVLTIDNDGGSYQKRLAAAREKRPQVFVSLVNEEVHKRWLSDKEWYSSPNVDYTAAMRLYELAQEHLKEM